MVVEKNAENASRRVQRAVCTVVPIDARPEASFRQPTSITCTSSAPGSTTVVYLNPSFRLICPAMTSSASSEESLEPLSLVYKSVLDQPIHVDIYPPPPPVPSGQHSEDSFANPTRLPAVVYFHGGALTVGNRRSWFPKWLHRAYRATPCGRESRTYMLSVSTIYFFRRFCGTIRPGDLLRLDLHFSGLSTHTPCYWTRYRRRHQGLVHFSGSRRE